MTPAYTAGRNDAANDMQGRVARGESVMLGIEEPAIQPMREYVAHPQWTGRVGDYQRRAQQILVIENGGVFVPWAHVIARCGFPMCLNSDCMDLFMPRRAAYAAGVCVYCGDPAGTMDHLIPRAWSGETQRRHILIVPACADCNNRINDTWAVSVTERRKVAHDRIKKKHAQLLSEPHTPQSDIDQFGNSLRTAAIGRNNKRKHVRLRLSWPPDLDYDRRAFELAGIEDPETLGLI